MGNLKKKKYCPRCKKTKLAKNFYVCPSRYDGLRVYCIDCTTLISVERKEYNKKYYELHGYRYKGSKKTVVSREYSRNYFRNRYKNDKSFRNKYLEKGKISRVLDREKHIARNILNEAVRKGKVKKEMNCEICGSSEFINGHHEDYTKPLEVVWLCSSCHKKRHLDKKHLNN